MSTTTTRTRTEPGVSLSRGPALVVGTVLEVAGLYLLYKQHAFPTFSHFPNGNAPGPRGKVFLGIFEANGWTGLFTAACGGLLLFGAAQHLLAKTMSLLVGAALGAAAVIGVVSGNVLGLAATNVWTEIGWGACAVILLFNSSLPRRRRTVAEPVAVDRQAYPPPRRRATASERAGAEQPTAVSERRAADEPVGRDDRGIADERATEPDATEPDRSVAADGRTSDERPADERPVDERAADERPADEPAAERDP